MKNFRSAIVLCGGKGTRLGVLGKKIPKAMIKIQGKEIIWYIINILKKNKSMFPYRDVNGIAAFRYVFKK